MICNNKDVDVLTTKTNVFERFREGPILVSHLGPFSNTAPLKLDENFWSQLPR